MDFDSLVDDNQSPQGSPNPMPTPPPTATPEKPMMFDDLKEDAPPKFDDLVDDSVKEEKYGSTAQQTLTGVEGVLQGIAGPLPTMAEIGLSKLGLPGLSAEDIKGRQEVNPVIHGAAEAGGFGASLLLGTGEARVAAHLGEMAAEQVASKVGAKVLNSAIQGGVFQASNEIEKGLIGQGDPEEPYASALINTGAAAILGGVFGGAGAAVEKGIPALGKQISHIGKVNELMDGLGKAAIIPKDQMKRFLADRPNLPMMTKLGIKLHSAIEDKLVEHTVGGILGALFPPEKEGLQDHPVIARVINGLIGQWAAGKVAPIINRNLNAFVFHVLGKGLPEEFSPALKYGISALRGAKQMQKGVEGLFNFGSAKAVDYMDPAKEIEELRKYIDEGGIETHLPEDTKPMAYAEGGEVMGSPGGISQTLPLQNMLMNATKARVSNYLKAHKPTNLTMKRAFDTEHIDPEQNHKYERLLHLTARPISVLNHIKDGSLLPQHVDAIKTMYPEIHGQLTKKIMGEIANKVHEGKKPPYHMRQSLSLFMGEDLDSSLTPQNMQAAQMVFVNQKASMQPKQGAMKNASKNAMTPDQGRTQRLNKG